MPTYPIRLDDELYRKLCARAQQEGRPVAALLRESANAAAGNPPTDAQLSAIREEMIKLSCSVDTNRALLAFFAAYLSRGNIDRQDLEKHLADSDAKSSDARIRHARFMNKIRNLTSDLPNERGYKNK